MKWHTMDEGMQNGVSACIGRVLLNRFSPESFSKLSNLIAAITTLLSGLLKLQKIWTAFLSKPPAPLLCIMILVWSNRQHCSDNEDVTSSVVCRSVWTVQCFQPGVLFGGQTKAPCQDIEGENSFQKKIELSVIDSFGDWAMATLTSAGRSGLQLERRK